MRKTSLCISLAACLLAAPTIATAICAMPQWSPVLITSTNQSVPDTGGVLVTAVLGWGGGGIHVTSKHPSVMALSIKRGKRTVPLRSVRLAPGLSRYVPRTPVTGTWSIVGLKGTPTVQFTRRKGTPLAAPVVRSVKTYEQTSRGRRGMITAYRAEAEFSGKVSTDVIGVIIYKRGVPRLFRRVPAGGWSGTGMRTVQLYASPGRCSSDVRDTQRPYPGQTVTLRWVDRFGQLSPMSKPVKVSKR